MVLGVRPPKVKECWDDCDAVTQARILAFVQTNKYVDNQRTADLAKAGIMRI